jgi:hypothetical protein
MYISRNKKQQILSEAGKFLEPFGLGLLCLLFIIPAFTFLNLSPTAKNLDTNVLGAQDEIGFNIELVGGNHNVFQNEHLIKNDEGRYSYDTKVLSHTSGSYSKPILYIENKSGTAQNITFSGSTEIPTGSRIGIIYNDKFYELQGGTGDTSEKTISIEPLSTVNVYLSVESFSDVQFEEVFYMDISFN